jgi:MFS family permease
MRKLADNSTNIIYQVLSIYRRVPNSIKAVGVVSFLLNTSTLMVYSIFGLYLSKNLGVSINKIGFMDGAIEGFAFAIKIFSGMFSDFLINRKLLIMIGSLLIFIAKPLEATAASYCSIFYAKILERFGNGLQATPRDAIVGDWAPKDLKGACFGMRQALAAFGSVVGAVASLFFFWKTNGNFQAICWISSIPALLAVLVVIFCVKDKRHKNPINTEIYRNKTVRKISFKDIKNMGGEYWTTVIVASSYMIAKVTESIIILHIVQKLGLPNYYGPICMICYQVANSFISFPAGIISDRLKSRDVVIAVGILVFIVSDVLFVLGNSIVSMIIALVLLGTYVGIAQSIFQAKIMDVVPVDLKGTGIGIFNFICAISLISGGTLAGYVANKYSTDMSFIVSSMLAVFSIIVLLVSKAVMARKKL